MRGHNHLIALRMQRKLPQWVSINVSDEPDWLADNWHEWTTSATSPHILIEPSDPVSRLDLRMLVGVPLVDVGGYVEHRTRILEVIDACVKAGARRVIGSVSRPKGEGTEVVEFFDTAGVLTWQE